MIENDPELSAHELSYEWKRLYQDMKELHEDYKKKSMRWVDIEKEGHPKETCDCMVLFDKNGGAVRAIFNQYDGEEGRFTYNNSNCYDYLVLKPKYYLIIQYP